MAGAQGLVCIFAIGEDRGSPRSSPRRQGFPEALHLDYSSPRTNQKSPTAKAVGLFWQGHKDLNPEPTVLETAALPIELYPYMYLKGEDLE